MNQVICPTCKKPWEIETNQIVPACNCGDKCPECIGGNSQAYIRHDGVQCSTGWSDCHICHGVGRIAPTPIIEQTTCTNCDGTVPLLNGVCGDCHKNIAQKTE